MYSYFSGLETLITVSIFVIAQNFSYANVTNHSPNHSNRQRISINENWRFFRYDTADKDGNIVPDANNMITVSIDGHGEETLVKVPLQPGTLDENGNNIAYIMVRAEKISEPTDVDIAKLKDEIFKHSRPNMESLIADPEHRLQRSRGDYYRVEAFYEKVPLKAAALDEHGNDISFVFVPAQIQRYRYEVIISEYKGGLYEILRTNMYVKFRSYRGFRIFSSAQTGILDVDADARSSRFYIRF